MCSRSNEANLVFFSVWTVVLICVSMELINYRTKDNKSNKIVNIFLSRPIPCLIPFSFAPVNPGGMACLCSIPSQRRQRRQGGNPLSCLSSRATLITHTINKKRSTKNVDFWFVDFEIGIKGQVADSYLSLEKYSQKSESRLFEN